MTGIFEFPAKIWRALPFAGEPKPLVTVLELNGVIGAVGPGRRGLSLARMEKAVEEAFRPDNLWAVALSINSPGGSAVQSRLLYSKIRQLADEKKIPVFAFIEDVGASGGYILALAADEIYADESSVVGSIGVVSAGFGFKDAIERLGIERRVYTAGENKSMLDPFKEENDEDVAHLKDILAELHTQFIDLVKTRRGAKLELSGPDAEGQEDLFSGLIWTGRRAKERGLVDGIGRLSDFVRARYGKDAKIKRCSPQGGGILRRFMAQDGSRSGSAPSLIDAEALLDAAEARALWARYGL